MQQPTATGGFSAAALFTFTTGNEKLLDACLRADSGTEQLKLKILKVSQVLCKFMTIYLVLPPGGGDGAGVVLLVGGILLV